MPDLDDLLRPGLSDAAGRAAQEPEFAVVRRRGMARRRRARAAVAGLALVVVAGTAGIALLPRGDATPPPTAPSPSPSPSVDTSLDRGPSAQRIVDDPRSTVVQMVSAPGDPDVRATLWQLCRTKSCSTTDTAIAVTDDGFRTRALAGLPVNAHPVVTAAGPGHFLVSDFRSRPYLVSVEGRRTPVRPATSQRIVRPGDVLMPLDGAPAVVDPESGRSYLVPGPTARVEQLRQNGDRLDGLAGTDYVWSVDGGASWARHPLDTEGRGSHDVLLSAAPDVHGALTGSDGATLFPFRSVERVTSDGWAVIPQPEKPIAYLDGSLVLPGGQLLLAVHSWSDPHYRGGNYAPGLWVTNGRDWQDLLRALPARPESPEMSERQIHRVQQGHVTWVGATAGSGESTVFMADGSTVYAVTGADAATWTPVEAR